MTSPIIKTGISLTTKLATSPAAVNATREATRSIAQEVAPVFRSASQRARSTVGQLVKRPDPSRAFNTLTGQNAVREVKHLAAA
jgi:hypothetical protein